MFGIGSLELIIILGVALLFLKPKDLISILKSFKEAKEKLSSTINQGNNYLNNIIEETELDKLKEQSKTLLEERTKDFYDDLKSVKESADLEVVSSNLEDIVKDNKDAKK